MSRPASPNSTSPAPLPLSGRSTTAPAKSHGHHHRPHVRSLHSQHHRDKTVPHSAVVPSSKTLDQLLGPISRVTSRLPNASANASRNDLVRASDAAKPEDGERGAPQVAGKRERENAQWNEVTKLKARRKKDAHYISTKLSTLTSMSTAITRKLDYTHYNLLSSMSLLSSTLATLSTLQTSTQDLCSTFAASTAFLSQDIAQQISTHTADSEARALRLESFEERMRKSKQDMAALVKRLDVVKARIEVCEKVDGARGRRQKSLTWGIAICLGAFLAISSIHFLLHGGSSSLNRQLDRGPVDVNEAIRLQEGAPYGHAGKTSTAMTSRREASSDIVGAHSVLEDLKNDPRLSIFDEL